MLSPKNSSHIIPTPGSIEHDIDTLKGYCQPYTAAALLPSILIVAQCALLHPAFVNSKLARLVRRSLTPINVYWGITFPFQYCFRPLESLAQFNMMSASIGIYFAIKSLEWGFSSGPYYKRPLVTVDGVKRWEKVKEGDTSYKKIQEDEPCNAFKLITWTVLQLTSMRGYQFTWGPALVAQSQTKFQLMRRLMIVNIPLTCALAVIIISRDSPEHTLRSGLVAMGVPDFIGFKYFAGAVHSICFGVFLSCMMECRFTLVTLVMTYAHQIAVWLRLSEPILELCDPIYYQPMFNSPQNMSSLADFWGKGWHTFLKRAFLVGGGKPAVWITNRMGISPKVQRLAGLFGTFAASAIIHEYLVLAMAQPPHSNPHNITSFPGSAMYFMVQPIAMLIEPMIIPMIPKRLGGGRLWLWTFSTLAAIPFRNQYMGKGRLDAHYRPMSQWSLAYVLRPVKDT